MTDSRAYIDPDAYAPKCTECGRVAGEHDMDGYPGHLFTARSLELPNQDAAVIAAGEDARHRSMEMLTASPTYSNDPAIVTRVVWYIASESVADVDANDQPIDGPDDDARMLIAVTYMGEAARQLYPGCNGDVYIGNGGFENQFAAESSRCETADGSIYEPFYDDMTALEERAIARAFDRFPTPEPTSPPTPARQIWDTINGMRSMAIECGKTLEEIAPYSAILERIAPIVDASEETEEEPEPMRCRYCGDDAPAGVCDQCDRKPD